MAAPHRQAAARARLTFPVAPVHTARKPRSDIPGNGLDERTHTPMLKRILALVAVLAMAITVAACGGNDDNGGGGGGGGGSSSSKAKGKVGVILPDTASSA